MPLRPILRSIPRPAALALAVAVCLSGPALASRPACTCQNLESLQQEYQNAVYLEGYMRDLAVVLKAEEDRLRGLKLSSNTDPDQDLSIIATVAGLRDRYKAENFRPPFWPPKGYEGPESVDMKPGTCEQNEDDLEKMEDGSACEAIADATLAHELVHRDLCNQIGVEAYWARPHSQVALEEAERYKVQAQNMKSELRRVLEAATVTLKGQWPHTIDAQGMMTASYFYETQSGDIGGASGGDTWTMAGQGQTSNSIGAVNIMGMNCTGSGAVRHDFDVAMTTDGLTFGLEFSTRRTAGEVSIRCPEGMGMSMPTSDAATGVIAVSQPLVSGDNPLPVDWADTIKAMMAGAGVSVTGDPDFALSVTCPAP